MNVMNIKHLLSAAAALSLLAACSDYDPGMSDNVVDLTDEELATVNEFAANFVERYGEIDPNHTWGFGEIGSVDEELSTRLGTRTNMPNNNQWVQFTFDDINDLSTLNGYTYNTVDNLPVPGFPSYVDGLYYSKQTPNGATWDGIKALGVKEVELATAGDVTDEEILYVSAWFRTHPNITSQKLATDNFFTQCISKDYDRVTGSYGTLTGLDSNGNGTRNWAETTCGVWDKNAPIIHYDEDGNVQETDPNTGRAWEGADASTTMEFKLDNLKALSSDGTEIDHIFNNNAGNTTQIASSNPTGINLETGSGVGLGIDGTSYRSMMYFVNSSTADFKAYSSSDTNWEYKWVLRHLTFEGRDGKQYDGWYLAFDMKYEQIQDYYEDGSPKKKVLKDYDGYYSNYIVKITPGVGYTTDEPDYNKKWHRIMCEDLGNTYDFDFNDLVFDVYYTGTSGDYTANITVQAAGGTMPIYLGDYPTEMHELMGGAKISDNRYQPINVGGVKKAPVSITIEHLDSTNPDDIDIKIKATGSGTSWTNNDIRLPKVGEASNAPQKICIPGNTTKWTKEGKQIEDGYPNFDKWVKSKNGSYRFADWVTVKDKNQNVVGWNLEPADGVTPWNTTGVDENFLFNP